MRLLKLTSPVTPPLRMSRLGPLLTPLLFVILALSSSPVAAASLWLSHDLVPGSAVLLRVADFPAGATLTGSMNEEPFPLTNDGVALLALDMESRQRSVDLDITITPPEGPKERLLYTLKIPPRAYEAEYITLPEGKVNPVQQDLSRAVAETQAIKATYALRGGRIGYDTPFRQAVDGRFSGVFGSRRVLNGQSKRPHNGVDIAAPKGTPVLTTAPGRVALAGKDYFFTGNTLVIHHGDGVVSLYAHLDTLRVQEGEWLPADTVIGTVGMTGRATGPHLHWGMLVRGLRVDPMLMPGIRSPAPPLTPPRPRSAG